MADMTSEAESQRALPQDLLSDRTHHGLAYRGAAGAIFHVALVNTLLSLLTLGLYRFWARTRLRRYFWSHVELEGDPIEYTGTGRELFIGFLIVLAILVPLLFGLQYMATLFPEDAWAQSAIVLVQALGLLFLIQVAVFRARRYRLGHTRWRGIRASQSGSAQAYAFLAFGYLLLTIATLGLAYPLFRVRTRRYLMENTYYGNQSFAFEAKAGPLLKIWLPVWGIMAVAIAVAKLHPTLLNRLRFHIVDFLYGHENATFELFESLAPIVAFVGLALALSLYISSRPSRKGLVGRSAGFSRFTSAFYPKAAQLVGAYIACYLVVIAIVLFIFSRSMTVVSPNAILIVLGLLAALLLYSWYRVREFRYFADVSCFGSVRFASQLKARGVVGLCAAYYTFLAVAAVAIFVVAREVSIELAFAYVDAGSTIDRFEMSLAIYGVLAVVALFLAKMLISVLEPVLLHHPLLKRVIASLKVEGRYDVEELLQRRKAAARRGEGLADAFDVDVAGF